MVSVNLNSENNLELAYFYCLESKCPMSTTKTKSIAKFASKTLGILPTQFTQLDYFSTMLYSYVREKKPSLMFEDCRTYLAWKIWHSKLMDVDRFVINNLCKGKAHLMASKSLLEFHKSASRIKSTVNNLNQLIKETKDDWELFNELTKVQEQVMIQADKALEVYNNLLTNHEQVMHQINEVVNHEIKQLGAS